MADRNTQVGPADGAAGEELLPEPLRTPPTGNGQVVDLDRPTDDDDRIGALADGWRPTDAGNARRLVATSGDRIRYVHGWGKWIVYRHGRWIIDNADALVTEIAKQAVNGMFHFAADLPYNDARQDMWKWAKKSEAASRISAAVRLARGADGILVHHRQLDADPWLLNVTNGTVDLRSGDLRPHNPGDLLTLQAPVRFDPDAEAPLWHDCLERWQPDVEQRAYLQRSVGSGIAGIPIERFFVNLGEGANGKSKFFGAINAVLGDYYSVPHKSLLVVQRHDQHDTVKAALFRTRMAVGAETDRGDRLDIAKIKDLTGGDPLSARRMREDPWEFAPTWTLHLHTNHRPRLRDTSEGAWRRVRLIEWPVTIPENERDEQLLDKLKAEAPGILTWLVDGCLAWQQRGLDEPARVAAATDAWRQREDTVGRFLDDRCVQTDDAYVAKGDLYAVYEAWCDENGERKLSAKALGMELDRRGFDATQMGSARTRTWLGLGLHAEDQEMPL